MRKGLAKEAVEHTIWFGRFKRGVKRFFVKIGEANVASLQLFENKLGFKKCGFSQAFKEVELEKTFADDDLCDRPSSLVNARPFSVAEDALDSSDGRTSGFKEASPEPLLGRADAPKVEHRNFGGVVGDGIGEDLSFTGSVLLMDGCCIVSLCSSEATPPAMGTTTVAMQSKFERMPIASTLLGSEDELSKAVAQHMSKRLGLQVFVSSSLPESAGALLLPICKRILDAASPEPPRSGSE